MDRVEAKMGPDSVMGRIVERVHERQRKWKVRVVKSMNLRQLAEEDPVGVICGSRSALQQGLGVRVMVEDALVRVDGTREVVTALARDWLSVEYPKFNPEKLSMRWSRPWAVPEPYAPMFAKPCTFRHGYLVDVRALWWCILLRFGWGVRYCPGRYVGLDRPPVTWPWPEHKVGRNSLVTAGFPAELVRLKPGGEMQRISAVNPRLNIPLANLVHDVMHLLASYAVELGAVHYHTDGAIFTEEASARRWMDRVEELGFEARVKSQGWGWVKGVGCYRVGDRRTKTEVWDSPCANVEQLPEQDRKLLVKVLGR
jgi:hypothetical protein